MNTQKVFADQYFDLDFSKFHYLLDNIKITDNIVTTQCPAVEVGGLDLAAIEQLYNFCKTDIDSDFHPLESSNLFGKWYLDPRSEGWTVVNIKNRNQIDSFRDSNDVYVEVPLEKIRNNSKELMVTELCQNIFGHWWDNLEKLRILRLAPGGWCTPHKDVLGTKYGLCNFWMPLHEFSTKGFKIFPLGFLKHRVGSLYLFEQSKYPHAIQQLEPEYRYVIVGKFKPESIPDEIVNAYNNNKFNYMNLFLN